MKYNSRVSMQDVISPEVVAFDAIVSDITKTGVIVSGVLVFYTYLTAITPSDIRLYKCDTRFRNTERR